LEQHSAAQLVVVESNRAWRVLLSVGEKTVHRAPQKSKHVASRAPGAQAMNPGFALPFW
jgi:hypothetical protein